MFIKTDVENSGGMDSNLNLWHFFVYILIVSLFSLCWKFAGWLFGASITYYQALVLTMLMGVVFQLYHILRFMISVVHNLIRIRKALEGKSE